MDINISQIKKKIENELGFELKRARNPLYDQKEKDDSLIDNLSRIDILSDKINKAEKTILEALQLYQKNELFWATLGYLYYIKANFPKAIKCFFKTIEINPKNVDNWIDLGFAYRAYGDFKTCDIIFMNYGTMIKNYCNKFDKINNSVLLNLINTLPNK